MARPLRIQFNNAWYHVMNRGRRRENVYYNEADYIDFLKILNKAYDLFELECHSYSLMPNHYHLLLKTPGGNLAPALRYLNATYTQRFNKRHKTDGALFRGRYKSILIDGESYLLQVSRYIHLNPIKAK